LRASSGSSSTRRMGGSVIGPLRGTCDGSPVNRAFRHPRWCYEPWITM
jgi:hypothetical protein